MWFSEQDGVDLTNTLRQLKSKELRKATQQSSVKSTPKKTAVGETETAPAPQLYKPSTVITLLRIMTTKDHPDDNTAANMILFLARISEIRNQKPHLLYDVPLSA